MIALAVIAGIEALALVAVVLLFLAHARETEQQSARERAELCNRIQRPELIPATAVEPVQLPDREPDGWAKVGRIEFGQEWLESE